MDTVGALVERARDREGIAFHAPGRSTGYSFREFATSAWKAGNLLSHYGVRAGHGVTVITGPTQPGPDAEPGRVAETPEPLFAALGALCLGATLVFDPGEGSDAAALVAPAAWLDRYEVGPGTTRMAYGDPPEAADAVHVERERWSENPVEPPGAVSADAVAVSGDGRTQADLLERAREAPMEAGDRVGLAAPLGARTVAPGLLAPLAAGATIVGGDPADVDVWVDPGGDVAVNDERGTRRA